MTIPLNGETPKQRRTEGKPIKDTVEPTRVLIVDDHAILREGLVMVLGLEPDLQVVGEAATGDEAVAMATELKPGLVLMEGGNGIDACREIKNLLPETKVLMLTSHSAAQAVEAAVLAGASGYLLKDGGRQELLEGIRAVANGESLLSPAVTSGVLQRLVDLAAGPAAKERSGDPDPLSAKEQEVLTLVAQGLTSREIAAQLIISSNTVRNHVSHIMDKLDMTRRSQAAVYAARHGMLDTKPDPSSGLDSGGLDLGGFVGESRP